MNLLQIKTIRIISNGSLFLVDTNFIKFKVFKLIKKDLLNYDTKKTSQNYKKTKQVFNYVNKYLKKK